MTQVPCELVSGGSKVAGTHAIAAPGASYAVDFSQLMKNAELLPPAAAGCTAGKIDEHREDESHRLRRQPVHGSGAAPPRLKACESTLASRCAKLPKTSEIITLIGLKSDCRLAYLR